MKNLLRRSFLLAVGLSPVLVACASARTPLGVGHGRLTELSRVAGAITLCDHKVPADVCTRHKPELVANFKRLGDWCGPHGVPESQCLECHPDLTFDPLPQLPVNADLVWISKAGEDVPSLEAHYVKDKVTVFDFYAEWCASCRKVDGDMYKRLARGDNVAYRKINIVDWDSPVAKRYMREVPTLPLVVVVGCDGKEKARLFGADLGALDRAIAAASR